jgi:hypothetical protein
MTRPATSAISAGGEVGGGMVKSCTVEGESVGAVRTIALAQGNPIRERLVQFDDADRSFSYAIIGPRDLPVADYVGTVKIRPTRLALDDRLDRHVRAQRRTRGRRAAHRRGHLPRRDRGDQGGREVLTAPACDDGVRRARVSPRPAGTMTSLMEAVK